MTDEDAAWSIRESDAQILHPLYASPDSAQQERLTVGLAGPRAGAIIGMAVGDALGAPYEFKPSQGITLASDSSDMTGGGSFRWAPGEWTDDTSMMIPILRAFRDTEQHQTAERDTAIVRACRTWAQTAPDVGNQTRAVLGGLGPDSTGADAREAAAKFHNRQGRSGGNGSLMRTAPLGTVISLSNANFFSPSAPSQTPGRGRATSAASRTSMRTPATPACCGP